MQHPEASDCGEPAATSAHEEQGGELYGEGCPGSLRLGSQVSTANWGWEPGAEIPDVTAAPFPVSCHCPHLATRICTPGTARNASDTVCACQPTAQSPNRGRLGVARSTGSERTHLGSRVNSHPLEAKSREGCMLPTGSWLLRPVAAVGQVVLLARWTRRVTRRIKVPDSLPTCVC